MFVQQILPLSLSCSIYWVNIFFYKILEEADREGKEYSAKKKKKWKEEVFKNKGLRWRWGLLFVGGSSNILGYGFKLLISPMLTRKEFQVINRPFGKFYFFLMSKLLISKLLQVLSKICLVLENCIAYNTACLNNHTKASQLKFCPK